MSILSFQAARFFSPGINARLPFTVLLLSFATVATAQSTPPDWLAESWEFRARDGGRWVTDNAAYRSENEPYTAYGIDWSYGPGNRHLMGRLYGIIDGIEFPYTFWRITEYWDPGEETVKVIQIGGDGTVGSGTVGQNPEGGLWEEQTFVRPDGAADRVGHESRREGDNAQWVRSFDRVGEDWEKRREYLWHRRLRPGPDTIITQWLTTESPARLLILGTYHFHNPKADYGKFEVTNILSPKKQAEIAELNELLARFRPTRIALERKPEESDRFHAEYREFRADSFTLEANEIYQLGFRLAARFDHDRLYFVDHPGGLSMKEVMARAAREEPELFTLMQDKISTFTADMERMQSELSIVDLLRVMNHPASLRYAQSLYTDLSLLGAGKDFAGAEVVTDWYERNLKIFANVRAMAAPGERVLLIVGQGHKPILEHLARNAPSVEYIDALDYLDRAIREE